MKTGFLFSAVLLVAAAINGCKKEDAHRADGIPYYQFAKEDKARLLVSYQTGRELVYKNQKGEEIKFTVETDNREKQAYRTGTFWDTYTSTHFYYDWQNVRLKYGDSFSESGFQIMLERFPVGCNYNTQNPVTGTPVFTGFLVFPLWNQYRDSSSLDNSVEIEFSSPVTSFAANKNTYTRVRTFTSNSNESLGIARSMPQFQMNVNKMYYDENAGLVGFDDSDGNLWRLQ